MSALVDSDVLIDVLRGREVAKEWLASVDADELTIPGIVGMELVRGCGNKRELARCLKLLKTAPVVWLEVSEQQMAFEYLVTYSLSNAMSIPDSMIAAMAKSRSAILYSFNVKHFRVVPGLDVREPYKRPGISQE